MGDATNYYMHVWFCILSFEGLRRKSTYIIIILSMEFKELLPWGMQQIITCKYGFAFLALKALEGNPHTSLLFCPWNLRSSFYGGCNNYYMQGFFQSFEGSRRKSTYG
jgi:hypothetical protein